MELAHADNYTCIAENPHGSDLVTWRVVVLRPPAPPSLVLIEARPRELELELRPAPRTPGHAPAKAYTLHWRLTDPEVCFYDVLFLFIPLKSYLCDSYQENMIELQPSHSSFLQQMFRYDLEIGIDI